MKLVLIDDELEHLRFHAHIVLGGSEPFVDQPTLASGNDCVEVDKVCLLKMSQVAGQDEQGTSEGNRGRTDQHAKRYCAVVG